MNRGDDGYKIGDRVELDTGEIVEIDGIGLRRDWESGKSYTVFESTRPNRKFRASNIKRLIQPVFSTVKVTCSKCNATFRVFAEEQKRYEHQCPDCVYEQEMREMAIFDQEGRKIE